MRQAGDDRYERRGQLPGVPGVRSPGLLCLGGTVMNCQPKQAACRSGRCPAYVQMERMPAPPWATFTPGHMALLVREPRLAPKMARQRERKVHRSPSQPLTGLMLSLASYRGTARYSRTDKPVSGGSQPPVIPRSVAFGCTVHHRNYTRSAELKPDSIPLSAKAEQSPGAI